MTRIIKCIVFLICISMISCSTEKDRLSVHQDATEVGWGGKSMKLGEEFSDYISFKGIYPGITSWSQTTEMLISEGSSSLEQIYWMRAGVHKYVVRGFNMGADIHPDEMILFEENELVLGVLINSGVYQNTSTFKRTWERFSPESLLSNLGEPSRVWLQISGAADGTATPYYIWLFYDQLGLLVRYTGSIKDQDAQLICFDFGESDVLTVNIEILMVGSEGPNLVDFYQFAKSIDLGMATPVIDHEEVLEVSDASIFQDIRSDGDACYMIQP